MLFSYSDLEIDHAKGLKVLLGQNLVIHCHHYNARLQKTIESNKLINGQAIIKDAGKKVFFNMLSNYFDKNSATKNKQVVSDLYEFLGFGRLNLDRVNEHIVTSDSSHYAEGWNCGSIFKEGKVCSFTEGYLSGALSALYG
jgi:hypothetical protein